MIRCNDLRLPLHDSGEADGSVIDHPPAINLRASIGIHAFLTLSITSASS